VEKSRVEQRICDSDCVLQVIVGRLRWNCYIKDAIWMLGFAQNIVFFQVNRGSVAEKSWLAWATGAGVAALAWNHARSARATEVSKLVTFSLFVDAVLLSFARQSVKIAMEWLWQGFSKGICSWVVCCDCFSALHVIVGRLRWHCYIKDAIWMLGFARNILFFRGNRGSVAEKSWLAWATGAGIVALLSNPARFVRAV